jgi:Secretion system C-terminal sorting domain
MKKLFIILSLFTALTYAQVAKKIIVEHTTNTWCSICASRNPGFYTNLNSQPGIMHISYYPSAPYAGCILNQHNKPENDGRTKFYGVYGSTPRLIIQGNVISSSANYASPSIFTPYLGQTSPFEITIQQNKTNGTSIISKIKIKTVAAHSFTNAKLYMAIAEDTIFYTGPNGEQQHYDVFRKALNDSSGLSVTVPTNIGDSIEFTFNTPFNPVWIPARLFTYAILQEAGNKNVLQAEVASSSQNDMLLGVNTATPKMVFNISPNPAGNIVFVSSSVPFASVSILNILGKEVHATQQINAILVSDLANGLYFMQVKNNQGEILSTRKFVKEL